MAGSYHNVRLPDVIERGATGGGEFSTTIIELAGGLEKRNSNWSQARPRYDLSYGILEAEGTDGFYAIRDFFYARRGSFYSFAFKDFGDFEIPDSQDGIEVIGIGDASTTKFQITKKYTSGAGTYTRIIEKPVNGTVKIYWGSTLKTSGYTVNYDTGEITFSPAPGGGVNVGVQCEFDVPVRFVSDKFDITLEQITAGTIPSFQIIGVLGERV